MPPRDAQIVGRRYGRRGRPIEHMAQWWPVYDRPPRVNPLAVGGACPPDMQIGRVRGGWSCVPFSGLGQHDRNYWEWRKRGVITGCFGPVTSGPPSLGQDEQLITPRTVGAATVGALVGLFFGYVLGKM